MALREKIELVIDVTGRGASAGLKTIKSDIDAADGAFGKLKAGAKSTFSNFGGIIAGGVAAAGAAIAGFGLQAIGDFQEVALSAGELSDKLGVTTEEASRLQEVAGDLGIPLGDLESTIGRMNREAANAPEKFDAIGASIARNKDGTVDVYKTFENVVGALKNIPDASTRAAKAQEIFGRSWQNIAEIVNGGAKGLRESMAAVEEQKVIDPEEVEKARKFRDMMDALKGKFESFALTVGEVLVDAANGFDIVIDKADELARWLTFRDARQSLYDNVVQPIKDLRSEIEATYNQGLSQFLQGIRDIGTLAKIDPLVKDFEALGKALGTGQDELVHYGPGLEDFGDKAAETAKKILENRDAIEEMNKALDAVPLDVAIETNDKYFESLNGLRSIASDAEEAISDFGATVQEEVDGSLKRLPLTLDATTEAGRKQIDALKPLSDAIGVGLADAYVQADGDQSKFMRNAKKVGDQVLGRLQREFGLTDAEVDELRKSLGLTAKDYEARFKMTGTEEARVKIGLLQGAIEKLPKDVQTKVTQQILVGDYQGAVRTIQDYNNRHPTSVATNSQGGNVAGGRNAVQEYNNNHPTTVRVNPVIAGGLRADGARASGGPVEANKTYVVGEEGPELFMPKGDGTIIPNGGSGTPMPAAGSSGGGGGGNVHMTFNVNVAAGPFQPSAAVARDVQAALATMIRVQGGDAIKRMLGL